MDDAKCFRLRSIHTLKNGHNQTIDLIPEKDLRMENNFYTVLVGNNGSGKSNILSQIAYSYTDYDYRNLKSNRKPHKILAITNSISDRFPMDKTKSHELRNRISHYKELNYIYIGTRSNNNSFSNRLVINKSIDIFLDSYRFKKNANQYEEILTYLSFLPSMRIKYRVNSSFIRENNGKIDPERLKRKIYDNLEKKYKRKIKEISFLGEKQIRKLTHFINQNIKLKQYESEIELNFSSNEEIDNDLPNPEKDISYIRLLYRVGIITELSFQFTRDTGEDVSFSELSSGEINIISTMLSVIPVICNNSLVLIDEPEISLHPTWQVKFISLFDEMIKHVTGCHIVIATHSHLLIANLSPESSIIIPLDFAYESQSNIARFIEPNGTETVEKILFDVFNIPSTRGIAFYELVSEALEQLSGSEPNGDNFINVVNQIEPYYQYISDNDPIKTIVENIIRIKYER